MREAEVIIVGGGPAGAACARALKQAGKEVLLLEKAPPPRSKPCAGWITPSVFRLLNMRPGEYPHSLTVFDRLQFYFSGKKRALPTRQLAIRRVEFDYWLLQRSGATVVKHRVREIVEENRTYLLDGAFRCRYLVGAGGTRCPVYSGIFAERFPRAAKQQIVALSAEFSATPPDTACRLWFFDDGLPGYAWYVPKRGGWLNLGIGGRAQELKRLGHPLRWYWEKFLTRLRRCGIISDDAISTRGCAYYLRGGETYLREGNAFAIGDAAGLATLDMGEGIAPAIHSGLLVAAAITGRRPAAPRHVSRYSARELIFSNLR